MAINTAPNLIGLGMAGTGFVGWLRMLEKLGAQKRLLITIEVLPELADKGLENFEHAPRLSIAVRSHYHCWTLKRQVKRVMDWGYNSNRHSIKPECWRGRGGLKNALNLGHPALLAELLLRKQAIHC